MRKLIITSRLLATMLVAMTAMCVSAQDSYREAVKEYLTATGALEKARSFIPTMSIMFEGNGQVDVQQLTKQYLDEHFENYFIDSNMSLMRKLDMTEADLGEVTSLLSCPEGKIFQDHQREWIVEFVTNMTMPLMTIMEKATKKEDLKPNERIEPWPGFIEGADPKPKAEIDEAYVAKFNSVILQSDFVKIFTEAMKKRMDEDPHATEYGDQSERQGIRDRYINGMPTIMLNSAYGILTPEDLDYAAKLFSNEPYCKLNSSAHLDKEYNQDMGAVGLNYVEWMQAQGAKISEDAGVALNFLKSMLKIED